MFLDVVNRLPFEPFRIEHMLDARRRYLMNLDPKFPFSIKLFEFPPPGVAVPLNWHERLEIFVPVAGQATFRVGDHGVALSAGDILVVDNRKLHRPEDFRGVQRRAMAISFLPEWVYHPGSHPNDLVFLAPFFCKPAGVEPVLRGGDLLAETANQTLLRLVECYFNPTGGPVYQAGCKAYLLELLHLLARHFGWTRDEQSEYARRRRDAERLGKLFEYLRANYAEKLTIAVAADLAGMSKSRFMRFFKESTGSTFVAYLTQMRLSAALRLLIETDLCIAEVASSVGMADQSYFDRKFKQFFHSTPRQTRAASPVRFGEDRPNFE
jgi:AraC-like DNA-binding protein/mannose-6-phosphate isomerase-like protein (cupin superfamily)